MEDDNQQQSKWYYFVTFSGMSGVTIREPDEIAKYRLLEGWQEVSEHEFDRALTSACYDNTGMYSSYDN